MLSNIHSTMHSYMEASKTLLHPILQCLPEHSHRRTNRSMSSRVHSIGASAQGSCGSGCVYVVKCKSLPFVKLGRWSGTLGALQSRYQMYYGKECEYYTFAVRDSKITERMLKVHFSSHRMSGELFVVNDATPVAWYVKEIAELLQDAATPTSAVSMDDGFDSHESFS